MNTETSTSLDGAVTGGDPTRELALAIRDLQAQLKTTTGSIEGLHESVRRLATEEATRNQRRTLAWQAWQGVGSALVLILGSAVGRTLVVLGAATWLLIGLQHLGLDVRELLALLRATTA